MLMFPGIQSQKENLKQMRKFYICADVSHTHTHTCSEMSYRIVDVECIGRAKTTQLNLTGE